MKVTKQTLPLFNEMYNLQFSEEEMIKAFSVQEELAAQLKKLKKPCNGDCMASFDHVIDNGLFHIVHTTYFYNLEGGTIRIDTSLTKKETDIKAPITTSYFRLKPERLANNSISLKIKNIDANQLYTFLENLTMCNNASITAMSPDEYAALDQKIIHDDLKFFVELTSGPKILDKIINKKSYKAGYINTNNSFDDRKDTLSIANWLMPGAKITTANDNATLTKKMSRYDMLGFVETVYEENNYRLGIIKYFTRNYYSGNLLRRLVLLKHTDTLFNYLDAGKILVVNRHAPYANNSEQVSKNALLGKFMFTDENTVIPETAVLNYISNHTVGTDTQLMDDTQVKMAVKKCAEEDRRKKEEENEKTVLNTKLKEKINSLKMGKELLLNNMKITSSSIVYEGQKLQRSDKPNWVPDFLNGLTRYYSFDDINFDSVFEHFISECAANNSSGVIGDVGFEIVYKNSKNKLGVSSTIVYVNKKRINKLEVQDCLRRAICYTSQQDFNEFLENVSSCSLKFHRYLQTGIEYEVQGLRATEGFHFKLPLERRKNIMYIVLGEHEYKVRNTNRLIDMQRSSDLGEIMELLLNSKIVEGLNIKDAKEVIKLAKFEYQDAVLKSEKLLTETEKTLKLVKQQDIHMNEIVVKEGYIVNGKMRQYVVANSDKCEVYEYPSGRYICIVDKSTSQAGKDRLINRLYALVNDQALAQDIHTLK